MSTETRTDQHLLRVHDLATQTLSRMSEQVAIAHSYWGKTEPQAVMEMSLSLNRNLTSLFNTGMGRDTTISRDGELSLYVSTSSGIVYGMIFHARGADAPRDGDLRSTPSPAPREGRYCVYPVEFGVRCNRSIYAGKRGCEGHDLLPGALPMLGTWSFHS